MAFAFERGDDTVEQGLQRIAIEQIDKALLQASGPQNDFDLTVHQLRRRCKNLRGLLRMVQPDLAPFKAEDTAIRTLAARLSEFRDAAVMVETFDALLDGAGADEDARQLHDMLVERSRGVREHIDQAAMLGEFCGAMAAMRQRAETWRLQHRQFGALAGGIEQTYRRMRLGLHQASADRSSAVLHAWRKQAKYHRHHMMLLRRHAPDMLESRSTLLGQLADRLGQHHDLAVLVEVLTGRIAGASMALSRVTEMAAERQASLMHEAFSLGAQLAAEKPRDLGQRLKRYWALELD